MLIKGHYFPGQKRTEKVVLFIRRHWVTYVPWISTVLFLTILPWIIVYFLNQQEISVKAVFDLPLFNLIAEKSRGYIITLLLTFYHLSILFYFLKIWIDYYLDIIIVTPEHLANIQQIGLFNRKVSEQSLLRVQDVTSRINGFFQTYFHFGTVVVETAGDEPNFLMKNVPNPNSVANIVLNLHEELVERGGFEEAIGEGVGEEKIQGSRQQKVKNLINKVIYNLPPNRQGFVASDNSIQKISYQTKNQQKIDNKLTDKADKGDPDVIIIKSSKNPFKEEKNKTTSLIKKTGEKVIKIKPDFTRTGSSLDQFKIENSWLNGNSQNSIEINEGELEDGEDIKL